MMIRKDPVRSWERDHPHATPSLLTAFCDLSHLMSFRTYPHDCPTRHFCHGDTA